MQFHVLLLRGFVSSSWLSLPLPDLFLQSVKEHPFRNTWFIFILQSSTLCPLMSLCFLFRSLKSLRGIIEQRWAKYLIVGSLSPIRVSSKEISPTCASRPILSEAPQAISWAPKFQLTGCAQVACAIWWVSFCCSGATHRAIDLPMLSWPISQLCVVISCSDGGESK